MLADHADKLGNAGCNDWKWPSDWTQDEREEFATLMVEDNVSRKRENFTDEDWRDVKEMSASGREWGPPDWWVALVLGKMLTGEVTPSNVRGPAMGSQHPQGDF